MSKFRKKKLGGSDQINTSALPDIIFMLLFFFMVTTVLREQDVLVDQKIPQSSQLQKLQNKTLISYIFIGKPKNTSLYGSEPRVQANDVLISSLEMVMEPRSASGNLSRSWLTHCTISGELINTSLA